ncbi:MAG: 50S ribosomal protein L32 [Bdellovibrionales bacterium RIFOXYD12_FULL_39_22]|nr:MAG: 50S ribosomal protein L32 [Bdellovibrionales bacterium RIFOXYB1_FULL_39_21]OFZ42994.1 MAG: 50S ribosomal protein L32 [Bdellovibrionales bacterium RIFOXYC12_FULL_39_17]OFZ50920.1 MAG: 50S ribosomal protein L32 [Bdellovibrionales bacterium RIFOXYC1_FULL_39_130]OFZ78143.1 MAG: 50S ribosomal protein L32 [Bdellovibrionales bacterium RIFOXYD1_FULL_39_84]OFZ94011.1 MAG: 50S ribosomal protein L32 [Bdellovibrionales bacterium RIFOXYD12_FULL_39_22]HLE10463.1 50S ribosomal protein L32 [Bacteriovo
MAVPKKKTSVSRKGKRRSGQHHKLFKKHTMTCPKCSEITLPHKICAACGTYRGHEIIDVKATVANNSQDDAQA